MPADVSLIIYNRAGREVKVLVDENRVARQYSEPWTGRNSKGEVVASGVYVAVLKVEDGVHSRKIVVIK